MLHNYVQLDSGTRYEIRRMYKQDGVSVEELSDLFGIPESLVTRVLKDIL